MKQLYTLTFFVTIFGFSCIQPQEATIEKAPLIQQIRQSLAGEFDNFQQAWQENTKEGLHQVETKHPHQHIHSQYRLLDSEEYVYFKITHSADRDTSNVVLEEVMRFWEDEENSLVYSESFSSNGQPNFGENLTSLGEAQNQLTWRLEGEKIEAKDAENNLQYVINGDTLRILQKGAGIFQNASNETFRMLKCRFFSGWIQYQLPEIPDSNIMMRNLKIHDQGGMVQLQLSDGTLVDYTMELTQLVYGKKISIMKLAVYDSPIDSVAYNSRSISYTWTNPEAKRIGINLRKVGSGWTLIEPNYVNSNNTRFKQ